MLVTDNPQVIARAILLSGSYMLYGRHLTAPDEEVFTDLKLTTPNYSGRMDNMRAAALRPQLPHLDTNCARWNERYDVVAAGLQAIPQVRLPSRHPQERYVGSSIQFFLPRFGQERVLRVVDTCADRGVQLKFFGEDIPQGYTSRYDSWQYLGEEHRLPKTLEVLGNLLDMRIPLSFDLGDCRLIVEIIADAIREVDV